MNYAIVEDGVVTNIIVLYPNNAKDFSSAVRCGDIPVATGDTYDGTHFYRNGEQVVSALTVMRQEVQTMENELPTLKAQIQAISDRSDFVEDCIAEMAMVVYADESAE